MSSPSSGKAAAAIQTCPRCSQPASGRFCANCGAALGAAACGGCGAALSPGARFCHRCGTPAGATAAPAAGAAATAPRGLAAALPWAVAAIALVALVALIVGQRVGARGMGGSQSQSSAMAGGAPAGEIPQGRAPDISNLGPEERAERLFDRIMSYSERGRQDSVQLFAPMAIAAYEMIPTMNEDHRYDLGRIGEVTGDLALARAQADTLLAAQPNHLLGLILAARVARLEKDEASARRYDQRLKAAATAEQSAGRREYLLHKVDIDQALARVLP